MEDKVTSLEKEKAATASVELASRESLNRQLSGKQNVLKEKEKLFIERESLIIEKDKLIASKDRDIQKMEATIKELKTKLESSPQKSAGGESAKLSQKVTELQR